MSKEIDITGNRYGKLVVIKKCGHHIRKSGRKDVLWECKCDCGNLTKVIKSNLQSGGTTSCGCVQKKNRYNPHRKIIIEEHGNYCSIELYNKEIALFDTEDLEKVNKVNWHLNRSGYACNGKGIPMHKIILTDVDSDMVVHHKNENKLDNRKENLIVLSRKEHTLLHDNLNITKAEAEQKLKEMRGADNG